MFASRLTPVRLQRLAQLGFAGVLTLAAVLMLGPFQGLEQRFGLNDTAAHAIAFYALTVGIFLCAARTRRTDLALIIFAFGLLIEVIQSQIGREMSLHDLAADAAGIAFALAPGVVESLRHHVRSHPHMTFDQIAEHDRRRQRRQRSRARRPAAGPAPGAKTPVTIETLG